MAEKITTALLILIGFGAGIVVGQALKLWIFWGNMQVPNIAPIIGNWL